MKIVKRRERHERVYYRLDFERKDDSGGGYTFECDEHGNVDIDELKQEAQENYEKCISGEHDVYSGTT